MDITDVLTPTEAEKMWGMKPGTIRSACTRGSLKSYVEKGLVKKSGGTWLVTKEAMKEVYGKSKEDIEMMVKEFGKLVDSLKGKEISLLELDNTLHPETDSQSIFEYDNESWGQWKDGNKSAFSYRIEEDAHINVWFEVLVDEGVSEETMVKVVDWEEI